jgi:hypothetical protein
VLGLLLNFSALVLLFRYGLPKPAHSHAFQSWLGFALLIAGTLCQIWANLRWVG